MEAGKTRLRADSVLDASQAEVETLRQENARLQARPSGPRFPWNRLRPEEEQAVLALARATPES